MLTAKATAKLLALAWISQISSGSNLVVFWHEITETECYFNTLILTSGILALAVLTTHAVERIGHRR
jgi:hypothetical protein